MPVIFRRLGRAVLRRCPRCGKRGIFTSWTSLSHICPQCGLHYEREEGYWLGAILINTAVTIGLFGLGMTVWGVTTWPDPPWGLMTGTGIAFNLLFPVLFYPFSKTLWVAIEVSAHPPSPPPNAT